MCIKLLTQKMWPAKSMSGVHQRTLCPFSAATISHDHYNGWGVLLDNCMFECSGNSCCCPVTYVSVPTNSECLSIGLGKKYVKKPKNLKKTNDFFFFFLIQRAIVK